MNKKRTASKKSKAIIKTDDDIIVLLINAIELIKTDNSLYSKFYLENKEIIDKLNNNE